MGLRGLRDERFTVVLELPEGLVVDQEGKRGIAREHAELVQIKAELKRLNAQEKHRHADTKKDWAHNTERQTKAVNGSADHSNPRKTGKVKSAR